MVATSQFCSRRGLRPAHLSIIPPNLDLFTRVTWHFVSLFRKSSKFSLKKGQPARYNSRRQHMPTGREGKMLRQWRISWFAHRKAECCQFPVSGCLLFFSSGIIRAGFPSQGILCACPPKFRAQWDHYQLLKTVLDKNLALANRIHSYGWLICSRSRQTML